MLRETVDINKGYVKIANNLFENIIFRDFSNRERAVICLIIRLSYGFNHKVAVIKPKSKFVITGMYRQDINKVINSLVDKKVLFCPEQDVYILNKHFDEWEVGFNKLYDSKSFDYLKSLQFVSEGLTKNDKICKSDTYNLSVCDLQKNDKNVSLGLTKNDENVSLTLTKNDETCKSDTYNLSVCDLQKNEICKSDTYNDVSLGLTKNENLSVPHLQEQVGNADTDNDRTSPKDIYKDINKDINIYIYKENKTKIFDKKNKQNFDPYFNNPVVDFFKEEYSKVFDCKRCYLDNSQINKLIEIASENHDFINQLPLILKKYSQIKFSNGISKFGLRGLINDGKWAAILNGDYDAYIDSDDMQDDNTCNLGIQII